MANENLYTNISTNVMEQIIMQNEHNELRLKCTTNVCTYINIIQSCKNSRIIRKKNKAKQSTCKIE